MPAQNLLDGAKKEKLPPGSGNNMHGDMETDLWYDIFTTRRASSSPFAPGGGEWA
jgi:hypothetical protein